MIDRNDSQFSFAFSLLVLHGLSFAAALRRRVFVYVDNHGITA